jgi:hypothetical protein
MIKLDGLALCKAALHVSHDTTRHHLMNILVDTDGMIKATNGHSMIQIAHHQKITTPIYITPVKKKPAKRIAKLDLWIDVDNLENSKLMDENGKEAGLVSNHFSIEILDYERPFPNIERILESWKEGEIKGVHLDAKILLSFSEYSDSGVELAFGQSETDMIMVTPSSRAPDCQYRGVIMPLRP